jgi:hypothetical protein
MAREKKPNLLIKTFKLSPQCVKVIEKLAEKYTGEAQITISMGKIVELAIFTIEKKSLRELLQLNSHNK